MNETLDSLRHQLAAASKAGDKVRSLQAALDEAGSSLQTSQEDSSRLRKELRLRSDEVADKEHEIEILTAERTRITRELAHFSEDLAVQRRECAAFGSELQLVRSEQATNRGAHADQLARLEESLRAKQTELVKAVQQAQDARHECSALQERLGRVDSQTYVSAINRSLTASQATSEQRQKFKVQLRRLSAQIEYLKAVYARENTFRNALALQKKFLLLCVGGMSLK
jgi:chromosome segregation ATPase